MVFVYFLTQNYSFSSIHPACKQHLFAFFFLSIVLSLQYSNGQLPISSPISIYGATPASKSFRLYLNNQNLFYLLRLNAYKDEFLTTLLTKHLTELQRRYADEQNLLTTLGALVIQLLSEVAVLTQPPLSE